MLSGFYLKKILGMLMMPVPLTLLLMVLAVLVLKWRPSIARFALMLAVLLLGLGSWQPAADRLLQPLESDYPSFNLQQPVDAVVVLGSGHSSSSQRPVAAQLSSSALFRMTEGLRILAANESAELFVSGYGGNDPVSHAEVMRDVAISAGIQPDRIRLFPTAMDTEAEARLMANHLLGKSFALVSEASHLPRAMVFFQQYGLTPIAAPAWWRHSEHSELRMTANALVKTERAFYEYLGQAWQWLKSLNQ